MLINVVVVQPEVRLYVYPNSYARAYARRTVPFKCTAFIVVFGVYNLLTGTLIALLIGCLEVQPSPKPPP